MVPASILDSLDHAVAETRDDVGFSDAAERPLKAIDRNAWVIPGENECWFFALFARNPEKSIDAPKRTKRSQWLPNHKLQTRLADILANSCDHAKPLAYSIQVVEREANEIALCIPCDHYFNIAALLQDENSPPPIVVDDWRFQVESSPVESCTPTTCKSFVTEDGLIICMDHAVQTWSRQNSLQEWNRTEPVPVTDWPWMQDRKECRNESRDNPSVTSDWLLIPSSSLHVPQAHGQSKRTRSIYNNPIAWTSAGILLFAVLVMSGSWFQSKLSTSERATLATVASSDEQEVSDSDDTTRMETDDVEFEGDLASDPQLVAPEESLTIDSLLTELNPDNAQSFSLTSTPTSIIRDVLNDTNPSHPDALNAANLNQSDNVSTESNPEDLLLSEEDNGPARRRVKLSSAKHRETLPAKGKIPAKPFRLVASLQVASKLIVQPDDAIQIDGGNKATFKVAMEDEDPEIFVELSTKSGTKWQVAVMVGIRETSNAPVIPVGPNDPILVGNRLLEYHRWLAMSIASLQTAKSNRMRSSRIDFLSEIKKLERSQRDVEKTIERWKVVEKLSRVFFESNELNLTLEQTGAP